MKNVLVIGSLNMDFVVRVDEMPKMGETILGKELRLIPGGKGANQAYACGRLGCKTAMIGAVGDDTYSEVLLQSLRGASVDVSHIARMKGVSTGMAVIMVDRRGENSITVVQGANALVTRTLIDENRSLIEHSDIVVMQLEIPLDTVVYAAKLAKSLGKTVILDPAPVPDSLPEELLGSIDVIKPNETELQRLVGDAAGDFPGAVNRLRALGVPNVIVTVGREGALVSQQGCAPVRVPSPTVPVVDSTAAGDAFTAGLAAMLGEGASLVESARFAARVGAVTVTREGAQISIPTREEVEGYAFA